MIAAILLALARRPAILAASDARSLDLALIVAIAGIGLQLVPLPGPIRTLLSPSTESFRRAVLLNSPADVGWSLGPLSIDPRSTGFALALAASTALVFWTCRQILARGGTRLFVRGLAWTGLAAGLLAIVQRATSPYHIYWRWHPEFVNAQPIGPYVNRNFFATWMIMAIPACAGYLLARLQGADGTRPIDRFARVARSLDARTVWLVAAACVMTLSVFMSRSRSGLISLAAGLIFFGVLARGRLRRQNLVRIAGCIALTAIVVVSWSNLTAVLGRFEESFTAGESAGRLTIWRETLPALSDFWLTGSGAGTYQALMLVYQKSYRSIVYFNHAHNHYLHLAVEGGLLVFAPLVVALVVFIRLSRERLRNDESGLYWIRAGAIAGLVAVAVQSVWDTGLRMPGNAFLFAALAALATYRPIDDR